MLWRLGFRQYILNHQGAPPCFSHSAATLSDNAAALAEFALSEHMLFAVVIILIHLVKHFLIYLILMDYF